MQAPSKTQQLINYLVTLSKNGSLSQKLQRRLIESHDAREEARNISKNMALVSFHLPNQLQEKKLEVIPLMDFSTFISNVGGLIGMWLGLSAVSLVECLERKLGQLCNQSRN